VLSSDPEAMGETDAGTTSSSFHMKGTASRFTSERVGILVYILIKIKSLSPEYFKLGCFNDASQT
jgi:hypothetical protein